MFKKPFLAAVIVLALSMTAWSQVQGKLMGIIRDAQGNPIEKASVHIVSTRTTSVSYELTTNKEGRFLQIGIQPGYFQVTVKKDGFMPRTTEARVSLAGETNLEFKLDTADEVALRSVSAADKAFLKGNKLYGEQQYAEAVAAYEEAVGMSRTNWGYFLNLGLAYKKLGKKDESLAVFRKAVELSPESYSSNKELGEALAKGSVFDEAKKYYQKAVDLSPDDPDAHYNLGACLTNTGEQDAALEHFRKTTELKTDYADAYYQMGTIYIGRNMVLEAVQSLEKFLELAPAHEKAPLAKQLLQYLKK
jgi:tetratricopeptide (TPR) repeat protein